MNCANDSIRLSLLLAEVFADDFTDLTIDGRQSEDTLLGSQPLEPLFDFKDALFLQLLLLDRLISAPFGHLLALQSTMLLNLVP